MDPKKVKILILEWVKLEAEVKELAEQRKVYCRDIKERTKALVERQGQLKDPILRMMSDIDTDSIGISDDLVLKSDQVTKTTSLTQPYIKQRICEYLGSRKNTYSKMLVGFADHYKINLTSDEIQSYLRQFEEDETELLFNYITDKSARKVYFDEEKISIGKARKSKKK
jgi:hypothetical protein